MLSSVFDPKGVSMRVLRACFSAVSLVAVAAAAHAQGASPLSSTFDSGIEGWSVQTRGNPAGSFNLIATFTPDYVGPGAGRSGYISELDPDGNFSFFTAPVAWSGNRSALSGGYLRYVTRTSDVSFPDGRLVVLVGGGLTISADLGVPAVNTWTRRSVRLSPGAWRVGSSASGAVASAAQVSTVLGSLQSVFIGLEFGSEALEERVDLDDVAFGVCGPDIAPPFGVLDAADVSLALSAVAAAEAAADQTPLGNADGAINFLDVLAYLALFDAGCP